MVKTFKLHEFKELWFSRGPILPRTLNLTESYYAAFIIDFGVPQGFMLGPHFFLISPPLTF